MTSEVVKYAPKAVIEELDRLADAYQYVFDIFAEESVLSSSHNHVNLWMYDRNEIDETTVGRELAVINHLFGIERLQPEREPRWYVFFKNYIGEKLWVIKTEHGDIVVSRPHLLREFEGLDHETAVKAQALYGGTIEEIK